MSNEMISVSRELLQSHLSKLYRAGLLFTHVEGLLQSIDDLRALLAKPEPLVECDACPTSGGCVKTCMKAPVTRPRGEPVAWRCRHSENETWFSATSRVTGNVSRSTPAQPSTQRRSRHFCPLIGKTSSLRKWIAGSSFVISTKII